MKSYKILLALLLIPMVFVASCIVDDQYDLGELLDPSQIHFRVVQDYDIDPGGNTVILINDTPETVSIWDYGTGRSNRQIDTVRFAFQGEYEIKFSAMTGGGIVEMEPVTIEVTQDNLNYVDDPLWTALSGGVGEEKTWILDIDARYFNGPLYFFGTDNAYLAEGGPWAGGDTGCYGDDCWSWEPDYVGNEWLMEYGDYGTMTFNLRGGPFVTVNHQMLPSRGVEEGTYFLDVNNKTLTMSGAAPLHNQSNTACVANWGDIRIMSITEDAIQLGVMRREACDGAALLVYNYVSQEYVDNWQPGEEEEEGPDEGFDPEFASGELLNLITGGPSSGRKWYLDGEGNPVDWLASGRGWTSSYADSYDWGWNDAWASIAQESWIRFDRFGGQNNYTRNQGGQVITGTFTINEETNEIILSDNNTLIQNPGHWMSPSTSTIRVVKAFPGESTSRGIWFGTNYDEGGDEWLAFHYVLR